MNEEINVYKMNDYEWWVSEWDIGKTNEWYIKEMNLDKNDNLINEIIKCNLKTDGAWYALGDENSIKILGNSDKLDSMVIGNLIRCPNNKVFKFTSFEEIISKNLDYKKPYCIAWIE